MLLKRTVSVLLVAFGMVVPVVAQNTFPWPATGSVGIGTTTPQQTLDVKGRLRFTGVTADVSGLALGEFFADTSGGLFGFHVVTRSNHPLAFGTNSAVPHMVLWPSGALSIGRESSLAPTALSANELLRLTSPAAGSGSSYITLGYFNGQQLTRVAQQLKGGGYDLAFHTWSAGTLQERMRISGNGDVVIGPSTAPTSGRLHVDGNITASGSISGATVLGAVYQDVAEWVPSTDELAPGTVVVLSKNKPNEVTASASAYDTAVAGVVSLQPGVLLGVEGADKAKVATMGRVKVRAVAHDGPIQIGDLLVTSDVPGTAMKSVPMQITGRSFHQPGTIIGKALEPLPEGEGEILVLLSMQ